MSTERSAQSTFDRSTPVLHVADYPRSRTFYTELLGFVVHEEGGEPARFGILDRGRAVVFLDSWHGGPAPLAGGWSAYFHVGDGDALLAEFEERGVELSAPRRETVYGCLEFEVTDPDGNVLCFGQPLP